MPITTDIDDKFVDYDIQKDPRYVFGNLGLPKFQTMRSYKEALAAESVELYTKSQWPGMAEKIKASGGGLSRLVSRIFNQKSEGSCVANAFGQGHETTQAKQFGKLNVIHVSAISVYDFIGRSAGSGAMVSDGLEQARDVGFVPLDNPENRQRFGNVVRANTGFRRGMPDNWEPVAKLLRFDEYNVCDTLEELVTALLRQDAVIVGREGHSICYTDFVYDDKGRERAPYPNSWDYDWGAPYGEMEGGFGFDSLNQIMKSAQWAVAVRTVVDTGIAA